VSARRAINGHAAAALKGHVMDMLTERDWTRSELCRKAYGVYDSGAPKGTSQVSRVLDGHDRLTDATAKKWAEVLGVTPESLLQIAASTKPRRKSPGKSVILPVTTPEVTSTARLAVDQDPFIFTANDDGTVRIKLDVTVPLAQALTVLTALNLPELLPGKTRPLALTHDKGDEP